jgi:hypothetical protein
MIIQTIKYDVHNTLSEIAKGLNKYLAALFLLKEDVVVLSPLVNSDGSQNEKTINKVVLQLLNISEKSAIEQTKLIDSQSLKYNRVLTIILSANFDSYPKSLKFIDAIADFIQFSSPQQNISKYMPIGIDITRSKIHQLESSMSQIAEIFKTIRSPYIPSLIYEITSPSIDYSIKYFDKLYEWIEEDDDDDDDNQEEALIKKIEKTVDWILRGFEFEPNTYSTWSNIRYVIDEYFFSLQKSGVLDSHERFHKESTYMILIGFGETMTSEDILNDYLRLEVSFIIKGQDEIHKLQCAQLMTGTVLKTHN